MPRTLHTGVSRRPYQQHLTPVYAATLLLILHSFITTYINSSFLQQFITDASVGTVYTIASSLTVIFFLFISRILHQIGNYKLTLALLLANFAAVLGMSFAESLRVAIPLFIIHLVSLTLIFFNIDVFMESLIGDNERSTGSRRGLMLTLSSLIGALAPFFSSFLVDTVNDFSIAYLLSALVLVPVTIILTWYFKDFSDPPYKEVRALPAIRRFWISVNTRYVFLSNFLLQMFFVFMVVYTPLYLTGHIGLSWTEFGIVIFFAQIAYVIFEYPIGIIADKYIGEKEMMSFGFLILALSTASISFITTDIVWAWAAIMFVTRVGASFAEVTTESYFFKQTDGKDAQLISFFRVTRPLSYVFGALISSLALLYLPFNLLFIVAGALMVPALFFIANITDTK